MACDSLELPDDGGVAFLFKVVHDFLVGEDLFKGVVVHGALESESIRMTEHFLIMFIDGTNNASTECLAVFPLGKEGPASQVRGMNHRKRGLVRNSRGLPIQGLPIDRIIDRGANERGGS